MGLLYFMYFALAWHAFWLLIMAATWYHYDLHPVLRKAWYRAKYQLRLLRTRMSI
jgi:hypothetical protein